MCDIPLVTCKDKVIQLIVIANVNLKKKYNTYNE